MHTRHASPQGLVQGLSFEVPELMVLSAWAEFHGMRMTIELDWHVDGLEFEEVITLNAPSRSGPPWLLWRTCESIVVQPMAGKPRRYETLTDALTAICPEQV